MEDKGSVVAMRHSEIMRTFTMSSVVDSRKTSGTGGYICCDEDG